MAETDPRVMSLVEAALEKNPAVSVQDLYDMAKKKKRSISSMTLRQFHARYPLQIKRKKNKAKGGTRRRKTTRVATSRVRSASRAKSPSRRAAPSGTFDRDAVRATLLGFASDLAAADSRSDAVAVVASVDRYVDQIERVAG